MIKISQAALNAMAASVSTIFAPPIRANSLPAWHQDEWVSDDRFMRPKKLVLARIGKKRFVARYEGTQKAEATFIGAYPKAKREFILYQITKKLLKN